MVSKDFDADETQNNEDDGGRDNEVTGQADADGDPSGESLHNV